MKLTGLSSCLLSLVLILPLMTVTTAGAELVEITKLKEQSKKGSAEATYKIGEAYYGGHGVPKNVETAEIWFRKAAEQGSVFAQAGLGVRLAMKKGNDSHKEAVLWLRKAALGGNPESQALLASMYLQGRGVEVNDTEALAWARKAASAKQPYGELLLGTMTIGGKGRPADTQQGFQLVLSAAEKGATGAAKIVADLYLSGTGVAPDQGEAIYWLLMAVKSGDQESAARLSEMMMVDGADLVAPFGLPLFQTTLKDVQIALGARTKLVPHGTNAYIGGPMLKTTGEGFPIRGLQSVIFIFDGAEQLAAVEMTLDKGTFDDVYANLASKYTLVNKTIPFVGDKSAVFSKGFSFASIAAPHMSFTMTALYSTKLFTALQVHAMQKQTTERVALERSQF